MGWVDCWWLGWGLPIRDLRTLSGVFHDPNLSVNWSGT